MASAKNKKVKSNTLKSKTKASKKCKIPVKKKKKRAKIRKSMTTDDLDKMAKIQIPVSKDKKKKIIQNKCDKKSDKKSNKSNISNNQKEKTNKSKFQSKKKKKHNVMMSMTTDDLDLIRTKLTVKSPKFSPISPITSPVSRVRQIRLKKLATNNENIFMNEKKNQEIQILNEEKQNLEKEVSELKQQILEFKSSEDMLKLTKELTMQNINNNHSKQINSMQTTIDTLTFEQKKLKSEIEHQNKLYEQKLMFLESDRATKETINEQLKNITNQIEYIRVPRNNDFIAARAYNGSTGGCCSSFWGQKKMVVPNTQLKEGSNYDFPKD